MTSTSQIGSRLGVSLGLGLGLGLLTLANCAQPFIVDPPQGDGGGRTDGDGGGPVINSTWRATPAVSPSLYHEFFPMVQDSAKRFREWKRDPHYFTDSGMHYVFFSGSPKGTLRPEQWVIASFTQNGAQPTPTSPSVQVLTGRPGQWDGKDLTAPYVRYNPAASGSERWMLWYAANGDPARPEYVSQIGLATSPDGNVWTLASAPAISTPNFSGTDANATPATARPDAYGLTDPWVLVDGSSVYMYYAGLDCASGACKYQILRSMSPDGGRTFPPGTVVFSGRPGVTEELGGVAGPSVIKRSNGTYLLAYTAVSTPPNKDRTSVRTALTTGTVGMAVSSDGANFAPATSGASLIGRGNSGTYNALGSTAPSLYLDSNQAPRAYFSGFFSDSDTGYSIATAELVEELRQ